MPLTLSTYSQPLAPSSLIVAPIAEWSALATELSVQVHPADLWSAGEEKPLAIAEVRLLRQFAARSRVGEMKLAIIRGADQLKMEPANALLKILEEPPPGFFLILLSESDHLLPTLRSRLTRLSSDQEYATLEGKAGSDYEAWRQAFTSFDLTDPKQRQEARNLLHLQALAHSGIKSDLLIKPFTSPR